MNAQAIVQPLDPIEERPEALAVDARAVLAAAQEAILEGKGIEPTVIDLAGKTTLAEFMYVVTGISHRHLQDLIERTLRKLQELGLRDLEPEGRATGWIVIDAGDVIVHLFRAEARAFYDLEKLWALGAAHRGGLRGVTATAAPVPDAPTEPGAEAVEPDPVERDASEPISSGPAPLEPASLRPVVDA